MAACDLWAHLAAWAGSTRPEQSGADEAVLTADSEATAAAPTMIKLRPILPPAYRFLMSRLLSPWVPSAGSVIDFGASVDKNVAQARSCMPNCSLLSGGAASLPSTPVFKRSAYSGRV
ncbi:MAG: hypothetical protein NVSMB51_00920 [Solirubrobacteraceae bacterium]